VLPLSLVLYYCATYIISIVNQMKSIGYMVYVAYYVALPPTPLDFLRVQRMAWGNSPAFALRLPSHIFLLNYFDLLLWDSLAFSSRMTLPFGSMS